MVFWRGGFVLAHAQQVYYPRCKRDLILSDIFLFNKKKTIIFEVTIFLKLKLKYDLPPTYSNSKGHYSCFLVSTLQITASPY